MKKLLHVGVLFLLLFASQVFAQNRTVTGTVTAKEDGLPLPGVSVRVQGTTTGTVTGADGKFTISAPSGNSNLVFTFIGYETLNRTITGSVVNATLTASSRQLGEVVVTGALGVKTAQRSTGYAQATVTNQELTQAKVTNFANGLTGKVSGLQINTVNNGIDPDLRITLRGNRHINSDNTALLVVDGLQVPSNFLNTINPDDIETVDILKGASGAALYGSEGSNGVLVVTTKRGSRTSKPTITYSNTFQIEKVSYLPDLQKTYGSYGGEGTQTFNGVTTSFIDPLTGFSRYVPFENQSYGPALNGSIVALGAKISDGTSFMTPYSVPSYGAPLEAFWNTGKTEQNNLSYRSGNQANNFSFSFQNVNTTGIVPMDKNQRTAFRISGANTYGKFRADYSVGYTQRIISTYSGDYTTAGYSPYFNLLQTPPFVPIRSFKDLTSPYADPNGYFNDYGSNPYWQLQNSRINRRIDAFVGSLNLNYKFTNWLDATYKIGNNYGIFQSKFTRSQVNFSSYARSDPSAGGNQASALGSTVLGAVNDVTEFGDGSSTTGSSGGNQGYSRLQQDIYVNFHHTFFNDFHTSLLLGNTIWRERQKYIAAASNSLLIPNLYNVAFITGQPTSTESEAEIRQIGYYGDLRLDYKNFVFVEGTLRNDHDSRLPTKNSSFWYPSVKGSFVFTDAIPSLKGNKILSYGKLRASYSQVGQVSVQPYSINNTYNITTGFPFGSTGGLTANTTANNANLLPEKTKEKEFGIDFGLFEGRVGGQVTYYDTHTTNQTFSVSSSPSTGYSSYILNAGELKSNGLEADLNLQVFTKTNNKVSWNIGGNLAINNSKVVSLLPGVLNDFALGTGTAAVHAVVGLPYGQIEGTSLLRDPNNGKIVVGANGDAQLVSTVSAQGSTTPKYILGLTTSVGYKFITLSMVAEYRTGYVVYNAIGSSLNFSGTSAQSASAGRQRFIFPNSEIQTSPGVYVPNTSLSTFDGNINYWTSSAFYNATSTYITSGAFWKLREVNLNFDLSQFLGSKKYVKGLSFALVGRNLLMFRPKSNMWSDPEISNTNGNAVGINDSNQTPPTRIFGANLNVTF